MNSEAMRSSFIKIPFILFLISACSKPPAADYKGLMLAQMEFNRQNTEKLLDEIEKSGKGDEALAWRAADGRAPLGWQLAHLAASEDRQATRIGKAELVDEHYADEFKSGKPAGPSVPKTGPLREYLKKTRASLVKSIQDFDMSKIDEKVPGTDNTYRKLFQIILWHEPHHQGQAHATFNLYKAAHHIGEKPGM